MEMNGWIKLHRKEHEWLKGLSDPEVRYYLASRIYADWDFRHHKTFGTFDVRTEVVRQTMLPHWSAGKINTVKNSLLKRGMYKKTDDPRRLQLTNAHLFLKRDKQFESVIRESEKNLHCTEYDYQWLEDATKTIAQMRSNLWRSKRVSD